MLQTADIARRLMRGGELHREAQAAGQLALGFAQAFAVIDGTVAVSTLSSTHVAACPGNSSNC